MIEPRNEQDSLEITRNNCKPYNVPNLSCAVRQRFTLAYNWFLLVYTLFGWYPLLSGLGKLESRFSIILNFSIVMLRMLRFIV
jgi:hypothetical protein